MEVGLDDVADIDARSRLVAKALQGHAVHHGDYVVEVVVLGQGTETSQELAGMEVVAKPVKNTCTLGMPVVQKVTPLRSLDGAAFILALQGAAEAENARRGSLDNLRRDRMLALRAPDSGRSIHLGTVSSY